eukprot:scaffold128953_cov51-Attheya_sp.AAC.3
MSKRESPSGCPCPYNVSCARSLTTTTPLGKNEDGARSGFCAMISSRIFRSASDAGKRVGCVPSRFTCSGNKAARANEAQSRSRLSLLSDMPAPSPFW